MLLYDYFKTKKNVRVNKLDIDNNHLSLFIYDNKGEDRFKTELLVMAPFPKRLYIIHHDPRDGAMWEVTPKEVLKNHNDLHSTFKSAYIEFIKELDENKVSYILRGEEGEE